MSDNKSKQPGTNQSRGATHGKPIYASRPFLYPRGDTLHAETSPASARALNVSAHSDSDSWSLFPAWLFGALVLLTVIMRIPLGPA
jgi:hypothetical protein